MYSFSVLYSTISSNANSSVYYSVNIVLKYNAVTLQFSAETSDEVVKEMLRKLNAQPFTEFLATVCDINVELPPSTKKTEPNRLGETRYIKNFASEMNATQLPMIHTRQVSSQRIQEGIKVLSASKEQAKTLLSFNPKVLQIRKCQCCSIFCHTIYMVLPNNLLGA